MFTQEEREYLDKKIQEVMSAVNVNIIPEDIRTATADDVSRVVNRQRMLIGFALVVFGAWSWLIYQVYSGNVSPPYFTSLVAAAITGVAIYMAYYFGKILSSELSQIPADSWTDWLYKYYDPTAAATAKSYLEARNQFITVIQYLMYILLAFVVVSFGLVVQIMYQPLSYIPPQWNPANLKFNVEYVPPAVSPRAGVAPPKAKRY